MKKEVNEKTYLIPTELSLVYCQGNLLTVEDGLNLSRKDELWGIRLMSGVMIALNLGGHTWYNSKLFANTMFFNGKYGSLPTTDILKKYWSWEEKKKYENTANVLRNNGISVAKYRGCIWCSEEGPIDYAYYFSLRFGCMDLGRVDKNSTSDRIGLLF